MKTVLKFFAIVLACALFVGLVNVLFPYRPGTGKPNTTETEEVKNNLSWHLNDTIDTPDSLEVEIGFVVAGVKYCKLYLDCGALCYYSVNFPTKPVTAFDIITPESPWSDSAYQDIVFTEEPPAALLAWLETYAVRREPAPDFSPEETQNNVSWHLNDDIDYRSVEHFEYTIHFVADNTEYCKIVLDAGALCFYATSAPDTAITAFVDAGGWEKSAYQDIVFMDEPSPTFAAWLEGSGVRQ